MCCVFQTFVYPVKQFFSLTGMVFKQKITHFNAES